MLGRKGCRGRRCDRAIERPVDPGVVARLSRRYLEVCEKITGRVATASLVAGWFLGGIQQAASMEFVTALHRAFLTLGAITIVSSLAFLWLRPQDGNSVSNRVMSKVEE